MPELDKISKLANQVLHTIDPNFTYQETLLALQQLEDAFSADADTKRLVAGIVRTCELPKGCDVDTTLQMAMRRNYPNVTEVLQVIANRTKPSTT